MKYSKGKVSDIQIAYIGGGSRGWAWTFMTDLALEDEISGTIRLYDIDRKAAQTNEVIGNHLMNRVEDVDDSCQLFAKFICYALQCGKAQYIFLCYGVQDILE